ncbi:MAG TPA: RagB/SusD family nutrient uptake outer membrane protein, partial [Puia sp.]|nr:RagB/SusD family nutrient uptake outer membrane protein [Puia sp.]
MIFYIVACLSAAAFTGCSKFLTQQPKTQITAGSYWKSQSDIDEGVAAMYNGLQQQSSYNFIAWGDGRSDNLTASTQYGNIAYSYNGLSATVNGTDWATIYTTLERTNDLLTHVPIIAKTQAGIGIGQLALNNYMAQGYAVRAYCYFQIIKIWG